MVICCVPQCGADSWKCDGSITFYDFPTNPDLAAKWIRQINTAIKVKPMWYPRGKPVICSKHFLHTDFKGDTDSLKPRCIPTVFGHRYIGPNPEADETNQSQDPKKISPLIVKVIKPQTYSNIRIVDVSSEHNSSGNTEIASAPEVIEIDDDNLQIPVNAISHNNFPPVNTTLTSSPVNVVSQKNVLSFNNTSNRLKGTLKKGGVNSNFVSKQNAKKQPACTMPKITKKKEKNSSDLIEIGPNTFLKINPEIIKVNKKQTPSGNTVLQFLMDQKLAKSYSSDLLPKLIQGMPSSSAQETDISEMSKVPVTAGDAKNKDAVQNNQQKKTVQHVLGHVVDTHVCEESSQVEDLTLDDDDVVMLDSPGNITDSLNKTQSDTEKQVNGIDKPQSEKTSSSKTDSAVIEKAPVLLTTNMPLSHCFVDKPKYILQLKQKSRQIASMKMKISSLTKKVEELEDRCIVQERQLSYSFIKRLKTIRKNASKGDPCATYILEQIRSYSTNSNKMRWSDSTLAQCGIWCRKAPYAYEYFKKADFFKLPCLGTVKRFIKKHPELKFQNKSVSKVGSQGGANDDDESSSDFDFDDSDDQNDANMSEDEKEPSESNGLAQTNVTSSVENSNVPTKNQNNKAENSETSRAAESITNPDIDMKSETSNSTYTNDDESATSKPEETNVVPTTIDSSSLELQEIILPSGEVVQCYSTNISNGTDAGNQYYIIPNVGDQNNGTEREYSVVTADSLPVILQNIDASQLQIQNQDQQLIFIANSSGQVECNETEVTSA